MLRDRALSFVRRNSRLLGGVVRSSLGNHCRRNDAEPAPTLGDRQEHPGVRLPPVSAIRRIEAGRDGRNLRCRRPTITMARGEVQLTPVRRIHPCGERPSCHSAQASFACASGKSETMLLRASLLDEEEFSVGRFRHDLWAGMPDGRGLHASDELVWADGCKSRVLASRR